MQMRRDTTPEQTANGDTETLHAGGQPVWLWIMLLIISAFGVIGVSADQPNQESPPSQPMPAYGSCCGGVKNDLR